MKKFYLLFLMALLPLVVSAGAVEINGIYYNLIPKGNIAEVTPKQSYYYGDIFIPEKVTYQGVDYDVTAIGSRAFFGNEITSIVIPNSVTSIGEFAFANCYYLSTINIPKNLTTINEALFRQCHSLTSITIPNSVTSIGYNAFLDCIGLTTISIPNSVEEIKSSAFNGCVNLKHVDLPNNISELKNETFQKCKSLTSIVIPNSVKTIGMLTFSECTSLTSITIPNSVLSISSYAFKSCSGLTSITLGSGISSIASESFANCTQLTDVYCYAKSVPGASGAFVGSYIEYATLHVPNGCSAAYKAVAPWKNFKSIVEMVDAKVKLSKTKATIEKGKTLTLKATVTPAELADKSVKWKSSNTKVATVTSAGKVKAVSAGTATITCTSVSTGAKATCKVTVGYVELDKTETILQKGKTMTLKATVYPTTLTDKTVTWESSNTKIATVTSAGKVKGVKAGTATITCTSNATGLKTTCTVNVVKGTVTLNKTQAYIEKGKTTTLKATVTPTTLTDKSVTWTSSDKSIATVSSSGKVKGVGYGTATITCTSKATGASATCQVTVGKVVISMSDFSLKKTRTTVLTATLYPTTLTDKSVTWTSSDKSVATVSSSGKVKGVKAGTATITCTSVATGLKGTCTVTVLAVAETRSSIGNDDGTTGIEDLDEKPAVEEPYDVYDLSGRKVANQVTSLDGLPKGIYIVNGKKMLKK